MKKFLWMTALLMTLTIFFTGCPDASEGGTTTVVPPPSLPPITWTVEQVGGTDGQVDSTYIKITFSEGIANLTFTQLDITGRALPATGAVPQVIAGTDNKQWQVAIEVNSAGTASVIIRTNNLRIETGTKTVTVYKAGEETPITFTADANGTENTVTTTAIVITFSEEVADLASNDITITQGVSGLTGNVNKSNLIMTGTGATEDKEYTLSVTVNTAGTIRIVIAKTGFNIDSSAVTVTVHKDTSAPFEVPDSGSDATWVWTKISEWDYDIEGGDSELGKGNIIGDDFIAILDAAQWKNTYLRVYYGTVPGTSMGGYPGFAIGNADGDADNNKLQNLPNLGPGFVDMNVKDFIGYINPIFDDYLYINNWGGAMILGVLLYVPVDKEPIDVLPDGVYELGIPNTGEGIVGKGQFGAADMNKINAASEKAYLMVTFENSPAYVGPDSGELGSVIMTGWSPPPYFLPIPTNTGKIIPPVGTEAGDSFTLKIMIANLKYAGKLPLDGTLPVIGFNFWDAGVNSYISQILLYDSPACDDETVPNPPETPWPPVEITWPDFDGVTKLGEGGSGNEWSFNSSSLITTLKAGNYFIIATTRKAGTNTHTGSNSANFGVMEFVIKSQEIGNWTATGDLRTTGATAIDRTPDDSYTYVVIDLSKLPDFSDTIASSTTNAVIGVQAGAAQLGYYCGYITDIVLDTSSMTAGTGADGIFFTKELDLDAPPPPPDSLPNFFKFGPFYDGTKTWATDGVEGSSTLTEAIVAGAKYFIAEIHTTEANGFGGLQFHHQGGTNWDIKQLETKGWTAIQPGLCSWGDEITFYIVVDLNQVPDWEVTTAGGGVKIILNWPVGWNDTDNKCEFKAGYLSSVNLTKPSTSVDLLKSAGDVVCGWVALDVPEGHTP